MTPDARSLAGPAIGSAWQPARPGQPRPLDSGSLSLVTLPTSQGPGKVVVSIV